MTIHKLEGLFQETFGDADLKISEQMTANEVPKWDSFNHIKLMIAIESEFEFRFSAEEISGFRNVGDIVETMRNKGVEIDWN